MTGTPILPTPMVEDINMADIGSVKTALQASVGGEITPAELEAVWVQETISGGEW